MIITIARQCGCMGDQIGKALAEKYFIPFCVQTGKRERSV